MTAQWKDSASVTWICSGGNEHPNTQASCRCSDQKEQRPPLPANESAPPAVTSGFFLTLPNFVEIPITGDLTIGRGLDSVIGLSFIQYGDVSHSHLEVRLDSSGDALRFLPVKKPEEAPVYYYHMPQKDDLSTQTLKEVVPVVVEKSGENLDALILDKATTESRLFCLGQHCFIRFDWRSA